MSVEKWKKICQLVNANKHISEKEYQEIVIKTLEMLGWNRSEIEEQRKIPSGAAKRLEPDIIITNKYEDLFVIEVKKPNSTHNSRNDEQLRSYMRQLRLNVGIIIDEKIHVFYENENCKLPVEILSIDFDENCKNHSMFIRLFSKESFEKTKLKEYCEFQLNKINLTEYISSEDYKEILLKLIRNNLISNSLINDNGDIINKTLKTIDINISSKQDNIEIDYVEQYYSEKSKQLEIEKVFRKIPNWLNKPNQINSQIFIKAMRYFIYKDSISYSEFESECEDIQHFKTNFSQMINFGEKNHAKIFDKNEDVISLWSPVKEFLKNSYEHYI